AHAFLHLLPPLSQHHHFYFPSHKGGQPALFGYHIESGPCVTLPQYTIHYAALVTPREWRYCLLLVEEIPLDQPGSGRTDNDHPGLGDALEPCRNRQGFSD